MAKIRNNARVTACRSRACAPTGEMKALLAVKLGKNGKSDNRGYNEILELVNLMKESNVWGGSTKGYFFKGKIDTSMRSAITSFAMSNGWQRTVGERIIKYGIIVRGGKQNRRHLLIFGYYKGVPNKAYCSLTVI